MIVWMAVLLGCQLLGEMLSVLAKLPIPGPVCGMALLFLGLLVHGGLPQDLQKVADALLSNLSLLFVPAGVGVMLHFKLLGQDWLPIVAALIFSTLLTLAVTAALMTLAMKRAKSHPDRELNS